jgi:hypothetical protein
MDQTPAGIHRDLSAKQKKPGLLAKAGLVFWFVTPDQPRVRERIWKLSKVYSATCHHRY